MTTFAVLATGPSMSQAVADSVRGKCGVVAVSDAYRLAPWADALASNDRVWWLHHVEALKFAGPKFTSGTVDGVEKMSHRGGSNSGLLGIRVAMRLGATRVLLLGYDMGGTHYFGPHPEPLKNTLPARFEIFKQQFARFEHPGVEIVNCTPDSALTCFPRMTLQEALCGHG